ncbi:uncharacterized protein LOC111449485 [Cucurbita moschata]|uniref:Uncharacterized protein LOC111449485 n=1 Tax=Cucurbita moschata TaxID=3662 RepID=A0A6J1G077_CUCMO|nr:uncharacterized protein LOC111449485 [Cucurbita moschata]
MRNQRTTEIIRRCAHISFAVSDIFPTSVKETRKKTSCLGIPLCFCWCKYHIYDHANARSRWFKPRTSIRSVFLQMLSDERLLEQSSDLLYQVAYTNSCAQRYES